MNTAVDAARQPRAGNLTATLVVVVAAELVLQRIASRLFLPSAPGLPGSGGGRRAAFSGTFLAAAPFLFHLAGVLGLILLLAGVVGAVRRRELFPPGMRLTLTAIGGAFFVLASYGVVSADLPDRFFVYLQISYGFLAALLVLGFLRGPVFGRAKLGVVLFALPGIVHAAALFIDRMSWSARSFVSASSLIRAGEIGALCAAASCSVLLAREPWAGGRGLRGGLALGGAAAAAFAVALAVRFDFIHAVALYGLRLEIPALPAPLSFAYVAAVFGGVFGAARLLAIPGGSRLAGYGVALMAVTGYQLVAPHELVLSLVGLSALCVGLGRTLPGARTTAAPAVVGEAEWRGYVSRLAAALAGDTAPEAVVVNDGGAQITRVRCARAGRPVSLRILRRADMLAEIEIVVGEPGRQEPDVTLSPRLPRLSRPLGPAAVAPRAPTGDPDFDRRFIARGSGPFADEPQRLRLLRSTAGYLALWSGRAVRYRAVPGKGSPPDHPLGPAPFDPGRVVDLVETLTALAATPPEASPLSR